MKKPPFKHTIQIPNKQQIGSYIRAAPEPINTHFIQLTSDLMLLIHTLIGLKSQMFGDAWNLCNFSSSSVFFPHLNDQSLVRYIWSYTIQCEITVNLITQARSVPWFRRVAIISPPDVILTSWFADSLIWRRLLTLFGSVRCSTAGHRVTHSSLYPWTTKGRLGKLCNLCLIKLMMKLVPKTNNRGKPALPVVSGRLVTIDFKDTRINF